MCIYIYIYIYTYKHIYIYIYIYIHSRWFVIIYECFKTIYLGWWEYIGIYCSGIYNQQYPSIFIRIYIPMPIFMFFCLHKHAHFWCSLRRNIVQVKNPMVCCVWSASALRAQKKPDLHIFTTNERVRDLSNLCFLTRLLLQRKNTNIL